LFEKGCVLEKKCDEVGAANRMIGGRNKGRELGEKLAIKGGESIEVDVVKCKVNDTNHITIRENDLESNTTCKSKQIKGRTT
jgi:hypothetical protein